MSSSLVTELDDLILFDTLSVSGEIILDEPVYLQDPITLETTEFLLTETGEIIAGVEDNILLTATSSSEAFGNLEVQSSTTLVYLEGVPSQESFGSQRIKTSVYLSGIESEEALGDVVVTYISFEQDILWNVSANVLISLNLNWNVGQGVLRWYRIQGCCKWPTAVGSGSLSEPFPGGCDVIGLETDDQKCVGGLGKQQFIQNILARSLSEVCVILKESGMKWQICSIKVFSKPADPTLVTDECNTLTSVPFADLPECIEIALKDDLLVKAKMGVSIYESTAGQIYQYVGGLDEFGEIQVSDTVGGEAVIVTDFEIPSKPEYYYVAVSNTDFGLPLLNTQEYIEDHISAVSISSVNRTGGLATVTSDWSRDLSVSMYSKVTVENLDAILSSKSLPELVPVTPTVRTFCGSCTAMPSILYTYHNLYDIGVLSTFLAGNKLTLPAYLTMRYSKNLSSWTSNQHLVGLGMVNKEKWNIVLTWSCTNKEADFITSPFWKFALLLSKTDLVTGVTLDSRICITFSSSILCEKINNMNIEFPFTLNTVTKNVFDKFKSVSSEIILYDEIGLFKPSKWREKPNLKFRLSKNSNLTATNRKDISSIFR